MKHDIFLILKNIKLKNKFIWEIYRQTLYILPLFIFIKRKFTNLLILLLNYIFYKKINYEYISFVLPTILKV